MKWIKDPKVEHYLKTLGCDFKIESVKITDIDLEESANRQVRVGKKINEDWVLDYATAMQSPDAAFPMTILNKQARPKKVWIWSGNHRIRAADLVGESIVDAYVLELKDARLEDLIPRIVNSWEGHALTKEEKLFHAKYLIDNHSLETKDAAKYLGLKEEWIWKFMQAERVLQKIESSGINANGLPRSILLKLSPLANDTNVLQSTANVLKSDRLSSGDKEQLILDVKACNTSNQRIAEIAKWEKVVETRSEKKRAIVSTPIRKKFLRHITGLNRLLDRYNTWNKLQIVDQEDFNLVLKQLDTLHNRLGKLVDSTATKVS